MAELIPAAPDHFAGLAGVVFDCDGVILDSYDANMEYYNRIKRRLRLPDMNAAEREYVHMHATLESIERIVPAEMLPEALEIRKQIPYRELMPFLRMNPGFRDLALEMRDMGLRLAINTNRTDTMPLILETFDLDGLFDPVVTAADVARPKPDPEGALRILGAWRTPASRVAYVGDSALDQMAARAAGLRFWLYGGANLEADLRLAGFPELRGYLRRFGVAAA